MSNGVHYCSETARYRIWMRGSVVADAPDPATAHAIYATLLHRDRVREFRGSEQWMVAAYGD
jgi:hypothetical protein